MPAVADPHRLEMLERSGLLRKSTSDRLEHLAYSAAHLVGADRAEINAVTGTEQVHVATWPDHEMLAWKAWPVMLGACHLVVERDEMLDISDAPTNPLCGHLPWVELYRGYLGAPIHFGGAALGALCVLSFNARTWSRTDRVQLAGLADLVTASLQEDS